VSILNELFLAADRAEAQLAAPEGALAAGFDGVLEFGNMTSLDVELLDEAITGRPWEELEPAPPDESYIDDGGDDPDQPWVVEIPPAVVDALAGLEPVRFGEVAERWASNEELEGSDVEILVDLLDGFVALARRARTQGKRLYFWTCL
jgi:hypothetical protein